jgi:WD40 repeat protein
MTRPRIPLPAILALAALLCGAAAAAPVGDDKKPAAPAPDPLPEGARLRLGTGHFRHGGAVVKIYALPDGKRLLTIAQDARARVWDIAAEKVLVEIPLAPYFTSLVFTLSPDGKSLASASAVDRTIRVWNLDDGKEALSFGGLAPNQNFTDLEYSADGKLLVSSHQDRTIRVWDAVAAREVHQFSQAADPNFRIGFNSHATFFPDGKAVAVLEDWAIRALDPEDGKELRWFGGHTGQVMRIAFSSDGQRMASVARDRAARVWDLTTGKTVAKLPLPVGGGSDVAFTADGKTLAVCCADQTVRLFDLADEKHPSRSINVGPEGLLHFALSRDGKAVYVSGGGQPVLRGYDVTTGKELYPTAGHVGGVAAVAWSADGKRLATSGMTDRSIILWDAATGKLLWQLPAQDNFGVATLFFTPDGKRLLSYGPDRTLRTWDAAAGKELGSFVVAPLAPQSFVLSPDAKVAAVATVDRKVRVWDVADEKELHVLELPAPGPAPGMAPGGGPAPPGGPVPGIGPGRVVYGTTLLSFAGDGRTLLAHSVQERVLRRFDAVTGKGLGEVKEATAAFVGDPWRSGNGWTYVVAGTPMTQLFETATGKVRQTFTIPQPQPAPGAPGVPRPFVGVTAAAVSPDGRTVATVSNDGELRFWDSGSGKVLVARKGLAPNSRLLAFAPDGKSLATAGPDLGPLLWEVPGLTAEGRPAAKEVTAETLPELWKDLSGDDAPRAWQAMLALAGAPKEALPFVKKQLEPSATPDAKQVARWLTDLDAEQFQDREKATEELVRAGKAAEDAVKKALANKPTAEARQRLEFILSKLNGSQGPNLEEVRAARAVELLEKVGSAEARRILEEIAKGADGRLTAEARAALGRLKAREPAP